MFFPRFQRKTYAECSFNLRLFRFKEVSNLIRYTHVDCFTAVTLLIIMNLHHFYGSFKTGNYRSIVRSNNVIIFSVYTRE